MTLIGIRIIPVSWYVRENWKGLPGKNSTSLTALVDLSVALLGVILWNLLWAPNFLVNYWHGKHKKAHNQLPSQLDALQKQRDSFQADGLKVLFDSSQSTNSTPTNVARNPTRQFGIGIKNTSKRIVENVTVQLTRIEPFPEFTEVFQSPFGKRMQKNHILLHFPYIRVQMY